MERDKLGVFQPGNTASKGRAKGSRNKLQGSFFDDLLTVYAESGIDALRIAVKEKPVEFVKMVAGLMPKELEIQQGPFDGLTDEQLAAIDFIVQHALQSRAEREEGTDTPLN
jgi:hypothetical protein